MTIQGATGKGIGLADTVLTAVVSKGVNLLGNALTAAGNDETTKEIGSRNLAGGKALFPECVQVVRGRFRTDTPPATAPWLSEYSSQANAYELLKNNGIWPADRPDFFFEGAIVTSEDKTAVTIRPLLAVMNKSKDSRMFSGKERNVNAFFAFSVAGASPDIETNPAATVALGPMSPGKILRFPATGSASNSSTPYEASWFTLSEADAAKPLTMTTLIAETEPGNPYFAFIASIFNDETVKKGITDRANIIVVPSARIAAEETEASKQKENKNDADTKLADAIDKLATCSAGGDGLFGKGNAAKKALREYLEADEKLSNSANKIRDEDIELINLHNQNTIAARCNDIYEILTGQRL
ncbi:hypothetical protein POF53_08495 [Mitsuaria sp. RG]|nr:hypothetical protein [Mitsuaria sp. RG]